MATRLYLPASGTPPLDTLAVDTNWELTNGLVRLPCFITKQDTALATTQMTWPATATQQWCWWQFQSDVLKYAYDWLTTDTVSMVIGKCAETSNKGDSHLAYVVRVVSGDGTTIRGVIGLYHATSTEFPLIASAATRIHNARTAGATAFASQAGDRIIVEVGLHGFTPASELIQMRIGDPSAIDDFALTAGLTTDLCPWVELSRDVQFGAAPEEHSGSAVISGNGSLVGATQKGGKGSALNSGKGALIAFAIAGMMGLASISGGPGHRIAMGLKGSQNIAAISGNGSVTATGQKGTEQHSGAAILSGGGSALAEGRKTGQAYIIISGNGTQVAAGKKNSLSIVDISGGGALTCEGTKAIFSPASISGGPGHQLAAGQKAVASTGVISGGGEITATGSKGGVYFGALKYHTGSTWVKGLMKIYIGGTWQTKPLKRWDGTKWLIVDTTGA